MPDGVIPEGEAGTLSINGCARCHGPGHERLTFRPLTHPYLGSDGWRGTHWAPCPANGEPIILGTSSTGLERHGAGPSRDHVPLPNPGRSE